MIKVLFVREAQHQVGELTLKLQISRIWSCHRCLYLCW